MSVREHRKAMRCSCGAWIAWSPSTPIEAAGWKCEDCGEFFEDCEDWRYGMELAGGGDEPSDADPGL
jgi:hypothetical protein